MTRPAFFPPRVRPVVQILIPLITNDCTPSAPDNAPFINKVKNGGVLSVEEGAAATFMGTSEFSDNTIINKQLGSVSCGEGCTTVSRGLSYVVKKGGAIHNKVYLSYICHT